MQVRLASAPAGPTGSSRPGDNRRGLRLLAAACWAFAAIVLGAWVLLETLADHWWPGTLVLFGPRWLWAVPLLGLMPAAALRRRRLLWPLAAGLAVVAGPVMGFSVSWRAVA